MSPTLLEEQRYFTLEENTDSLGKNQHLGEDIKLLETLSKKGEWTFIEQVTKSGLTTIKLDQNKRSALRQYLLSIIDNKSTLNPAQVGHLVDLFEKLDIPLITKEAQYLIAGIDSIEYARRAPQFFKVFVSYSVIAASLAGFDDKHGDQNILQNCKHHDVLKLIAANLSHGSFAERYSSISALSFKVACIDVYVSKIEGELHQTKTLSDHKNLIKDLRKIQLMVKDMVPASQSKPFIEFLEERQVHITDMLQRAETKIYIALLQESKIQEILLEPLYKDELFRSKKNKLAINSDDSLVSELYRTPSLNNVRQALKDFMQNQSLNSEMVKEIVKIAFSIKQREERITVRVNHESANLGNLYPVLAI